MHLIGIELGTTGLRAVVYDINGTVIYAKETEIKEQTTNEWIKALVEIFPTEILKEIPPDQKIFTIDSTSGTMLLVDKYGEPLFPPLMYYEKSKEETVAKLYENESIQGLVETGYKISSTSPLPKIIELKQANPQAFQKVRWIVSAATWLLYTLHTKKNAGWTDIQMDWTNSLKLGTDIIKPHPEWFISLFEAAKIPPDLLPQIVSPGTPIGPAESELAEKLGILGATICQGMTDGTAGALTMGLLHPNDMGISIGSTTVPKIVVDKADLPLHPAIYYHRHPIHGYLASSATGAAGTFFSWFIEKVIGIPIEEAVPLAETYGEPGQECIFFPQGDRSPFDDANFGAAFLDLWPKDKTSQEARGNFIRGLIIGSTMLEYIFVALFEELFQSTVSEVKLIGKSTAWPFWNKLRASTYEKPVKIAGETSIIGALMPALLHLKLYKSPQDLEKLVHYQTTVNPDLKLIDRYKEKKHRFYAQWQALRKIHTIG